MVRTRTDTRPPTPLAPEPITPEAPGNPPVSNLLATPINRSGIVMEEPSHEPLQVDRDLAIQEIAKQYARPPTAILEPQLSNPDDVHSVCSFLTFVSKNSGHGVWWTHEIEKWISNNIKPDSPAGLKYEAYMRDRSMDTNELGVLTYFRDFDDFRMHFLKAIYAHRPLREIVNKYVKTLLVSHRDEKQPKSLLELVDRARTAYLMMPLGTRLEISSQIDNILERFPIPAQRDAKNYAELLKLKLETYDDLLNLATIIDNQFRREQEFKNENPTRGRQLEGRRNNNANGGDNKDRRPPRTFKRQDQKPWNKTRINNNSMTTDKKDRGQSSRQGFKRTNTNFACAKCGKMGHSIYDCWHASEEEKDAFRKKVAESKAAKKAKLDGSKASTK